MLFIRKSAQQLTEADLVNLVGVSRETEAVDFKEYAYPPPPEDQLPSDQKEKERIKNEWKLSLCTDLSAMANASGGWIICGMKEQGGVATEICGLGSQINTEREIARLGQAANTGIEPLISGLDFGVVPLQDANQSVVVAIRIPRSSRIPHRVKASRKFHIRRSGRNDEMNIDEIRTSFNLSESYVERIKGFRQVRVDALVADEQHVDVPVPLESGALLVVHSVPLNFADPGVLISFKDFEFASKAFDKNYLYRMLNNARFNIDGVNIPFIDNLETRRAEAYFQIHRSGAVEYVRVIDKLEWPNPVKDTQLISVPYIEYLSLFGLKYGFKMQANLGIEPPFVVMLSLLRIKGRKFDSGVYGNKEILARNAFLFPDAIAYTYEQSPPEVLRPIFDVIWNASGFNGSPSYDQNGKWIGQYAPESIGQ